MKFKPQKTRQLFLRVVLVGLFGFALTSALYSPFLKAMPSAKPPQSVTACFPKVPIVSSAEIVFSVRQNQTDYYLMSSDQSQEDEADLLISVDRRSNHCALKLFNPTGDILPLSRFVPVTVARQFALLQVKEGLAQAGSRTAYQQQIMQVQEWTPEELWAVQKLGFKVPKNIKVIAPENVKVSPEQNFP